MPNFERSVRAPTHSDEWIEFWGEIYLANSLLAKRGVLFETFLFAPREILAKLSVPPEVVRAQIGAWMKGVASYLEQMERGGARCSNGAWIEKLSHTRLQRTRHRRRDLNGRLL